MVMEGSNITSVILSMIIPVFWPSAMGVSATGECGEFSPKDFDHWGISPAKSETRKYEVLGEVGNFSFLFFIFAK